MTVPLLPLASTLLAWLSVALAVPQDAPAEEAAGRAATDGAAERDSVLTADAPLRATVPVGGERRDGFAATTLRLTVSGDGVLHVWARSDALDPRLEVSRGDERFSDDDGGGSTTAALKVPVQDGQDVEVAVLGDVPGAVELALVLEPRGADEVQQAARLDARVDALKALYASGDRAAAAERLQEAVAELADASPPPRTDAAARTAYRLMRMAESLGLFATARTAGAVLLDFEEHVLPPTSLDLARTRFALAGHGLQLGADDDALGHARRAAAAFEHGAPADLYGARTLLGQLLAARGDLAGAVDAFAAALAALEDGGVREAGLLGGARLNLSIARLRAGDVDAALTLQQGLADTLPDGHPLRQPVELALAQTLLAAGDVGGADALLTRVLAERTQALSHDDPALQRVRLNLAATRRELGDLPAARELTATALAVLSRRLPPTHPDVIGATLSLTEVDKALGDLDGARAAEERALALLAGAVEDEHPLLLGAKSNLAHTLRLQGDVWGARALVEDVLAVRRRVLPPDHRDVLASRLSLGIVRAACGDRTGARAILEEGLADGSRSLPADDPSLQRMRLALAGSLAADGQVAEAVALAEEAVQRFSRGRAEDDFELVAARGTLASLLQAAGERERALALRRENVALLSERLPRTHPDLWAARIGLASTWLAGSRAGDALPLLADTVGAMSGAVPDDHALLLVARRGLASALAATGDADGAREAALALSHGLQRRFASLTGRLSPREAEAAVASARPLLDRVLALRHGEEDAADSFALVEAARGIGLRAAAWQRRVGDADADAVADARRAARYAAADLARALADGDGSALAAARERREEAERRLASLAGGGRDDALTAVPGDVAPLLAALGEDDVAVAWWRYDARSHDGPDVIEEPRYLALVARADGRVTRHDVGAAEAVDAAVQRWRDAVDAGTGALRGGLVKDGRDASRDDDARRKAAGDALRALVLDPLRAALSGAGTVHVLPDGALHLVPLDALPAGAAWSGDESVTDRALLGDVLRLVVRPSLAVAGAAGHAPVSPHLLVVGGVDYGAQTPPGARAARSPLEALARQLPPLPATAGEAEAVVALFERAFPEGGVQRLGGEAATPRALLDGLPDASVLHVATHGVFAPESLQDVPRERLLDEQLGLQWSGTLLSDVGSRAPMLLVGLALAGAAASPPDGLLTAEELSAVDATGCRLAVLSACDTSVGLGHAGQGLASLQKALHLAGVRAVLASLWKVPDEATADLMVAFYDALWGEDLSPRDALWRAKATLREAGRPPRDWAGWVVSGPIE